jgi:hypothetical protein
MVEFTYNASALGAGGVVRTNGVETIIPSIASVALAPTGGAGESRIDNYYSEALSFKLAHTTVSGSRIDGIYTTQTYVYMTDLVIFNRLKIGMLRGVVTSTQGDLKDDDHQITLDVSYNDVRTIGRPLGVIDPGLVDPAFDDCVTSLKRYSDLDAVLGATPGLAAMKPMSEGVNSPVNPEDLLPQFRAKELDVLKDLVRERRALRGSVVTKVDGEVAHRHHEVRVPNLGTVRFGELMFKPGRRRVNLLRIALGKDTFEENFDEGIVGLNGGSLTIASVEGNGTPVYP